jgi:AhpC/TSA family
VTTLDGKHFALRDPKGAQRTALVFLSPWCESYLKESRPAMSADCRSMREQTEALARDAHLRWVGIASGLWVTPDDLQKYRDEFHVKIPLALDESGDLFRTFAVTQVPAVLIVDAQGKLARRIEAERARRAGTLLAAIDAH